MRIGFLTVRRELQNKVKGKIKMKPEVLDWNCRHHQEDGLNIHIQMTDR